MSEHVYEDDYDPLPEEPNGEVVHWMAPKPLRVGPAGISIATASAFAVGAATAVAVLALMHWLKPQRTIVAQLRRRLGR
jgi:hypothetical protein